MPAIISTTRSAWYRLLLLIVGLHALFYLFAILAVIHEAQWICILFSVIYSVLVLVIGFAPDTFGVLIVGSVLWGILPTTGSVANAITIIVKDFVRGVVYLAMVNSFMLFFLGTWNFGRYPGSAAVIIAAALMLGYWGVIYKGDEWFKKIVLWYGVGAILISLLVSFIPGIVPGKSERELSRTEQLLDENRDKQLTKKQKELQERIQKGGITRDQLSDADKKILEEARDFSRTGQAISLAEEIWVSAAKPENRIWWYIVGLVLLLAFIFRILKNSKVAAWIVAIVVLITFILLAYRDRDSVEKGLWDARGSLDKAVTREVTLSAITGVELEPFEKPLSTRYFRVRIHADKDTYWGTCDDGDIFRGISVINNRVKESFSSEANLSDGNIVIQGDSGSPTRDGGLVEIKNKPLRVFLDTEKKKPGCKTDAPLKVSIQFIPENP